MRGEVRGASSQRKQHVTVSWDVKAAQLYLPEGGMASAPTRPPGICVLKYVARRY